MENTLAIQENESVEIVKKKKNFIKYMEPYLYLIPSLTIFGVFVYFPFFKTIYLSLMSTDSKGDVKKFIAFENYKEIIKSSEFINSIMVTIKFVLMTSIIAIIIGIILALLANSKLKGSRIYEVMYAMPMSVASASAAIIWMMLFHPSIGFINYIFKLNIGWLIDPKWALISVAIVTIWMNIGLNFIFILTGLKGIPKELNESADIDGATHMKKLFNITLPMISPTLFFVVFINIINSFQAFGQVNIMTKGGPGNATNLLVYGIYREAFFNNRIETASAQSIILFLIMLVITIIQFKFERKGVHYS